MSTPREKTQSNTGTKGPKSSKFEEGREMWFAKHIGRVKIPVKLLAGLAAGAMLIGATAFVYQELNQGKAGSPPSSEQTENLPGFLQTEVWLPGDTYPASMVTDPEAVRPLSNRVLERLDHEADMILFDAARSSAAGRPLSNRELERLDHEADMILFDAARHSAAGRPLSSEQIQCYPEDVVLGWCYGFAATSDPALATGTSVSGVRFEEWPDDAWRFDSPYYDDFLAVVVARPPSINGIRCYPEDDC